MSIKVVSHFQDGKYVYYEIPLCSNENLEFTIGLVSNIIKYRSGKIHKIYRSGTQSVSEWHFAHRGDNIFVNRYYPTRDIRLTPRRIKAGDTLF